MVCHGPRGLPSPFLGILTHRSEDKGEASEQDPYVALNEIDVEVDRQLSTSVVGGSWRV